MFFNQHRVHGSVFTIVGEVVALIESVDEMPSTDAVTSNHFKKDACLNLVQICKRARSQDRLCLRILIPRG